ncbi:RNA polymerase sigma factor [Cohnella cellulosilytica]|uniref:RNA polymerase sigma factor n=1 Tax=Cohnella cellulosilytica TaxID=986710 RepID=A0ABW2FA84_9BACL
MDDSYLVNAIQIELPDMDDIVRSYWKDIWNYAFFLTKKYDAADDIAQETFISAFRSIDHFRGQCTLKTWLLKICQNRAMNYRRSAFFRKIVPVPLVRKTGQQVSAETDYFAGLKLENALQYLLSLPLKYREILLLEIRHELSMEEISNLLGIPQGTVKSRLHRARQLMQKKVEEDATL